MCLEGRNESNCTAQDGTILTLQVSHDWCDDKQGKEQSLTLRFRTSYDSRISEDGLR